MKAHQKRKHDRRVAHQRAQRERKLDALKVSIDEVPSINKKHMVLAMEKRGYYFVGTKGFSTKSSLMLSSSWRRMEQEDKKSKAKKIPGS